MKIKPPEPNGTFVHCIYNNGYKEIKGMLIKMGNVWLLFYNNFYGGRADAIRHLYLETSYRHYRVLNIPLASNSSLRDIELYHGIKIINC